MRTHLEFRSRELLEEHDTPDLPQGRKVAELLRNMLPSAGFEIDELIPEDWGWCVRLRHDEFPLWIGCGFYPEYDDCLLCFIEPSKPFVRRWLKRIPTTQLVDRLATALEAILLETKGVQALRWWPESEVNRG
ncbi:hypothetical protein [Novosphingobium sp. SG919]|uniref:hypothetical protein n=1 Tax=Novosphingobium sp. SG919 TaxID=2587133 RepID=UPI00146A52CF|nr:hypothetical protein [Novosphingobium sp. SG919]NMN06288.1 hypothetical protein [Novosphingobium sp. SG919]NMN88586.1 hypothetical protein [Novosphingobium sp. SG916]